MEHAIKFQWRNWLTAAVVVCGAAAIARFGFTYHDWRPWDTTQAKNVLQQEEELSGQLDATMAWVHERNAVRSAIFESLIRGDITVAETIRQNKELNNQAPEIMTSLRNTYPAASDDETVAKHLLQSLKCYHSRNTDEELRIEQLKLELQVFAEDNEDRSYRDYSSTSTKEERLSRSSLRAR